MKVKETIPILSSIIVVIDDLKYKDTLCTIKVTCNPMDNKGKKWRPTTAECEEPFFIMGSGFWQKALGTRQTNRIKKLCDKAIKDYVEEEQECKTCGGVEVVSSGESCMYNCEMGGTDCEGMTDGVVDNRDACDRCGKTVPCPKCMPVANEYYLLWTRDNTSMNFAHQKIKKLEKQLKKK